MDAYVLTPNQITPISGASTAQASFTANGNVESFDQMLEFNVDEIWKFFITNLHAPKLFVNISGSHTTHHRRRNSHGSTTIHTTTVTDFDIKLDVSHYINQIWSKIVCEPRRGTQEFKTFRQILEDYCASDKTFKDIILKKQVIWAYNEIYMICYNIVRSTGYYHSVNISFQNYGNEVQVHTGNAWNKMANNVCCRVLCVVSCLCVLFWPMYCGMKKKNSHRYFAY